jgi:hypothetical protein
MKLAPCPKCRVSNTLVRSDSLFYICKNCKNGVDVEKNASTMASHGLGSLSLSGILLGKTGTLKGKRLTSIGRLQYQGQDDEDTWVWEELLLTDGSSRYWLEYEPEYSRFTLFAEVPVPTQPPQGKAVDLNETGTLTSVEGELPWVPAIGERVTYSTYQTKTDELYSIENEGEEAEHFRGDILDSKEVALAFGIEPSKHSPAGAHGILSAVHKSGNSWVVIGSVLVLTLGIITPLFEQKKFEMTFTLCPANATPGNVCVRPGDLIGPIPLKPRFKTYGLRVSSNDAAAATFTSSLIDNPSNTNTSGRKIYRPVQSTQSGTKTYLGEKNFRLTHASDYYLDVQAFTGANPSRVTLVFVEKPLGLFFSWFVNILGSFFL